MGKPARTPENPNAALAKAIKSFNHKLLRPDLKKMIEKFIPVYFSVADRATLAEKGEITNVVALMILQNVVRSLERKAGQKMAIANESEFHAHSRAQCESFLLWLDVYTSFAYDVIHPTYHPDFATAEKARQEARKQATTLTPAQTQEKLGEFLQFAKVLSDGAQIKKEGKRRGQFPDLPTAQIEFFAQLPELVEYVQSQYLKTAAPAIAASVKERQ